MNCNYKVKISDVQTKYKFKIFCTGYDDSEIKEKIDTMYQAWPKATAEGETPTLDNTANATMSIDLKGNTSQETTTGKNLFDNSLLNKETAYQATISISNGVLTITSISSTGVSFARLLPTLTLSPNTQYACSFDIDGAFLQARLYDVDANDYATITTSTSGSRVSGTFTTSSNTTYELVLYITLQQSCSFSKIQVEQGSTATAYEPYTNGASPNPDYPQDVEVVTGDNTINICGKNLFNGTLELGGIDINNGNNYSASDRVRTKEYIPVQPNTEYIISGVKASRFAIFYDSNKGYLGYSLVDSQATSGTITTLTNTEYIRWYAIQTNTNVNEQLELGTTATTYAPYQSQSYAVNLGSMELCKIGDYQDYIYKDNGKWYKHSEIGEYIFQTTAGTNTWYVQGTTNYQLTLSGINRIHLRASNQGLCNYFRIGSNGNDVYLYPILQAGVDYLRVSNATNKWETIDDFKSFITNNQVKYIYVLDTPTNTEITDATLISQLNALAGAESYSGQTNISQTNDDKPFILTAKALKDLSNL